MADKYILKVTAGPSYADQRPVAVNSEEPIHISSPSIDADVRVRVQNYRGLPSGSPSTSPYFAHERHKHDLYSLGFSFTPKKDIPGHDLVLGNDFDHPIRDKLPPGFQQAFRLVTWFIDPGMYGDVNADEPYLYSPLLSAINTFRVGPKDSPADPASDTTVLEEGADGDGSAVREHIGMPAAGPARQKFFLTESRLHDFTFEAGRTYSHDFFNPYLDFNDFALRLPSFGLLPGITIPIISYWDGQPLRYVLKNRATDEPLFVVVFTLLPRDGEGADATAEEKKENTGGGEQTIKGGAAADGGDDELD